MVSIKLICVGGLKEEFFRQAAREYIKRLGAYCKISVVEVAQDPDGENPALLERALDREAAAIKRLTPPGSFICAMTPEGKSLSSPALAKYISQLMLAGESSLVFIIGGSNGLSQDLKSRVNLCLSMSEMTFPHHLARIMALEQLYRAFKINEGSAYHK